MAQWSEEVAGRHIRRAKSDKSASDEIYREAVELTFPDRENWTKQKEGTDRSGTSWDSQPQVSVIRAANRLSSDFTPQFQDWIEIGLGPVAKQLPDDVFKEKTGRSKEVAERELENLTAIVQSVFHSPGFATASNELYIDWHYGQGGMSIMPSVSGEDGPVDFQAVPLSHFYAYEGPSGKLDRWFFWYERRPDAIIEEWPDAKLSAKILEAIQEEKAGGKTAKPCKLVGVVYRDYEVGRYRYEVFHEFGSTCERIVSRSYNTSPFQTPRYSKLPGENRGRGPILFALPDIRTTNKIVELTLRAAAIAVAGIYTVTDNGVKGPVRIKPLAVMQVRSNGGPNGPSLMRLDTPQRIDFGELLLDKLHESIKKVLGDHSLPPEAGPIRTATEFVQRARELLGDQAGGLGRLHSEFIVPSTQRIVDILEVQNLLPTKGLQIDGFIIQVRMKSPLARQEQMQEVENVVRFVEMLKMLGGDQMAMLEVDIDKASKHLGDLMDVPKSIRNTDETKAALKKAAAQVAAAQAGADPNAAGAAADQMGEDAA